MEKIEYETMFSVENDFWWYRGLHDLVLRFVRPAVAVAAGPKKPLRILDAGCGTGRMMELLLPCGEVEGFDFSEEAVGFCTQRGISSVSRQDLTAWHGGSGQYDVIISLDVLCHNSIIDEDAIVKEFHRALKPGGTLIVNLPAFELLRRRHDRAVHTRKRYAKKETIARYEAAGFFINHASYRLPHLFLIIFCKKWAERLLGDTGMESDVAMPPRWLNALLTWCNLFENRCIASGVSMPLGTSLFIVARK
jgi:SAM-dependent methyltransferase